MQWTVVNRREASVGDEPQAEVGTEAATEAVEQSSAATSPVSHVRPHRAWWRTALVVLLVVGLVAGATVAGVLYGRASAPGPDIIVRPEPVVEEPAAAEPMPVGAAALDETANDATPQPWPVILNATTGLPDTSAVATGYRLVNGGISGAQVASVLAATFGAVGTPVETDNGWTVGTTGAPTLTVDDDPLVSWRFEDAASLATPAPGKQLEPARAIELASALLSTIGVDTRSVDWQVDRYYDRTVITAWQLVAGERTELAWRVAFDPSGEVLQASGFSAGLEAVPGYPVVGAATAIERVRTTPWASLGPSPVSGPDVPSDVQPSATASAQVSPTRPGLTVPLSEVTVTGAELALAQYWQPDGSVLMLPAYTLTGVDGSRWSVPALAETDVQFAPQSYPTATPATP